jgi:uncharacterized membrane protein (Fun14 family)
MQQVLVNSLVTGLGSFGVGNAMGFALKKVLKWMLIIIGFLAGIFFVSLELLQRYVI